MSLRLRLVEVLGCHWASSEVGRLLRGYATSVPVLAVVILVLLLNLLPGPSGVGGGERLCVL